MTDLDEATKKEIIETLKQLEGIKRKLHSLLKGNTNESKNHQSSVNA